MHCDNCKKEIQSGHVIEQESSKGFPQEVYPYKHLTIRVTLQKEQTNEILTFYRKNYPDVKKEMNRVMKTAPTTTEFDAQVNLCADCGGKPEDVWKSMLRACARYAPNLVGPLDFIDSTQAIKQDGSYEKSLKKSLLGWFLPKKKG